jgi:hypothetical protein
MGFASNYLSGLPTNFNDLSSSNALWLQTADQGTGLGTPNQDFIGPTSVPEPASLLLVGSGIIIIGGAVFRKWKSR